MYIWCTACGLFNRRWRKTCYKCVVECCGINTKINNTIIFNDQSLNCGCFATCARNDQKCGIICSCNEKIQKLGIKCKQCGKIPILKTYDFTSSTSEDEIIEVSEETHKNKYLKYKYKYSQHRDELL